MNKQAGLGVGLLVAACASTEPNQPPAATVTDPGTVPASAAEPLRVLVTGFNDWRDLGTPPNVWRCRDNPSCRLVLGAAATSEPQAYEGPLVARLRARSSADRPIAWTFATLPVTWEIAKSVRDYADHDIVVHLGLGVYDRTDTVFVEDGAFNRRHGTDAAGRTMQEPILATYSKDVLGAPAHSGIPAKVRSLQGKAFAGYRVEVQPARASNDYLCNETHFWALQAVSDSQARGGRLRQAFFVHIPYAAHDDYEGLADGIAGVVFALVD